MASFSNMDPRIMPRWAVGVISACFGAGVGIMTMGELKRPTGNIHTDFNNAVGQAYVASPERDAMAVINGVTGTGKDNETISYGLIAPKGAVTNAALVIRDSAGETRSLQLIGEPLKPQTPTGLHFEP